MTNSPTASSCPQNRSPLKTYVGVPKTPWTVASAWLAAQSACSSSDSASSTRRHPSETVRHHPLRG